MLDTIKLPLAAAGGALACAVVAVLYVILIHDPSTRSETRALVQAEAREAALALIQQRNDDNVEISAFDQQHLCVELGGKWVQPDRCD
ncbi:hypothetical protein EOD10_11775 [Mesorhizobium sp. M7A.T.Ca.TU.009.01.3.2]|nr:hypothetical protein EOD10_11775 [Mesorhizobium sp. M7A.T.Ca.TU.009.01.3.2]